MYLYALAKAKKTTPEKPKKKGKHDTTISTNLSFEKLMKMAVNTPPAKKNKNTKG